MALALPDAHFVGIDLSSRQIDTGCATVAALKLGNVDLHPLSILDVDEKLGAFDYVICHGVYSWVPPAVQEKILAICSERLTPTGVAYVSYNTYPGWHLRSLIRDLMRWRTRGVDDPVERLQHARGFLDLVARARTPLGTADAYSVLLKEEAADLENAPDDYVFHEHLEDHNEPLYFHEFVRRAGEHGLVYLDDARPSDARANIPVDLRPEFDRLAADRIEALQYIDFVVKRTFRSTLLCRAEARPEPSRLPAALPALWLSARLEALPAEGDAKLRRFRATDTGVRLATDSATLGTALATLTDAWPRAIPFPALVTATTEALAPAGPDTARVADELADALLRCYLGGTIELHTRPAPCAPAAGKRPLASPFARLQATRQSRVTNLLHRGVELPDVERDVLCLLDGTRDRAALAEHLVAAVVDGRLRLEHEGRVVTDPAQARAPIGALLDACLERLARAGLLLG
jgi:methyltransferase-like protein